MSICQVVFCHPRGSGDPESLDSRLRGNDKTCCLAMTSLYNIILPRNHRFENDEEKHQINHMTCKTQRARNFGYENKAISQINRPQNSKSKQNKRNNMRKWNE